MSLPLPTPSRSLLLWISLCFRAVSLSLPLENDVIALVLVAAQILLNAKHLLRPTNDDGGCLRFKRLPKKRLIHALASRRHPTYSFTHVQATFSVVRKLGTRRFIHRRKRASRGIRDGEIERRERAAGRKEGTTILTICIISPEQRSARAR